MIFLALGLSIALGQPACGPLFSSSRGDRLLAEYQTFYAQVRSMPPGLEKTMALRALQEKRRELGDIFTGSSAAHVKPQNERKGASASTAKPKNMVFDPSKLKKITSRAGFQDFTNLSAVSFRNRAEPFSEFPNITFDHGVMWSEREDIIAIQRSLEVKVLSLPELKVVHEDTQNGILSRDGEHFAKLHMEPSLLQPIGIRLTNIKSLASREISGSYYFGPPLEFKNGNLTLMTSHSPYKRIRADIGAAEVKLVVAREKPSLSLGHRVELSRDGSRYIFFGDDSKAIDFPASSQIRESPTGRHISIRYPGDKAGNMETRIVDLSDLHVIEVPDNPYLALSPNGEWLLSSHGAGKDGYDLLHYTSGGKRQILTEQPIQFLGNSDQILVKNETSGKYEILDLREEVPKVIAEFNAVAIGVSPSGQRLLMIDQNGKLELWEHGK